MVELRAGSIIYGHNENEKYEVIREIGRGSFGTVYAVKERSSGRTFAAKTIQATTLLDSREHQALLNEGKLAPNIDHPNVVHVYYFHDGERHPNLPPYLLMEYVVGGNNLQKVIDGRKPRNYFILPELINIFIQLTSGMQAINERLVHRDIKPDNILVDNGVYKISDFGLSKVAGAATRSETFKGINHIVYSAPEAIRSEQNLPLMDMYSMGIVFFQVATLNLPYVVKPNLDPFTAWREAHLFQQPRDPAELNPELDLELSQMILKMISKRPADRYQSWDDVLQRLRHVKNAPDTTEDVITLLQRDIESRRKLESEALDMEKKALLDKEKERFLNYAFNQILQSAEQIVEHFNRSSDFSKLEIEKEDKFSFSIQKEDSKDNKKVDVRIEVTPTQSPFQMHFPGVQLNIIKAWGIVRAPSGYGFNIVLVTTGEEDLYGEWRTIYKTLTYPIMGDMQNPKTTPYKLKELPSQTNRAASRGLYEAFDAKKFISLIEEIL